MFTQIQFVMHNIWLMLKSFKIFYLQMRNQSNDVCSSIDANLHAIASDDNLSNSSESEFPKWIRWTVFFDPEPSSPLAYELLIIRLLLPYGHNHVLESIAIAFYESEPSIWTNSMKLFIGNGLIAARKNDIQHV